MVTGPGRGARRSCGPRLIWAELTDFEQAATAGVRHAVHAGTAPFGLAAHSDRAVPKHTRRAGAVDLRCCLSRQCSGWGRRRRGRSLRPRPAAGRVAPDSRPGRALRRQRSVGPRAPSWSRPRDRRAAKARHWRRARNTPMLPASPGGGSGSVTWLPASAITPAPWFSRRDFDHPKAAALVSTPAPGYAFGGGAKKSPIRPPKPCTPMPPAPVPTSGPCLGAAAEADDAGALVGATDAEDAGSARLAAIDHATVAVAEAHDRVQVLAGQPGFAFVVIVAILRIARHLRNQNRSTAIVAARLGLRPNDGVVLGAVGAARLDLATTVDGARHICTLRDSSRLSE